MLPSRMTAVHKKTHMANQKRYNTAAKDGKRRSSETVKTLIILYQQCCCHFKRKTAIIMQCFSSHDVTLATLLVKTQQ